MPGYTHMQQAMPSSVALWAGGARHPYALATFALGLAIAIERLVKKKIEQHTGVELDL